jgi:hypothetical protein
MALDQHESPGRPTLTPEEIIALKEALQDEQTRQGVSDFMAESSNELSRLRSGEVRTAEYRAGHAAIIGEGLAYIVDELPGEEWIDRYYSPEAIFGALQAVQQRQSPVLEGPQWQAQ